MMYPIPKFYNEDTDILYPPAITFTRLCLIHVLCSLQTLEIYLLHWLYSLFFSVVSITASEIKRGWEERELFIWEE